MKSLGLHFECESHFGLDAAAVDLEHQLDERLLDYAALGVAFAGESVEPVADDAWQVHILNKSDLVDGLH